MQLGPTSAIPCCAGDLGDLELHRGRGLAALDHPAARDDHGGDAGRGGVAGHHAGPQRVERDERDVRALGQVASRLG